MSPPPAFQFDSRFSFSVAFPSIATFLSAAALVLAACASDESRPVVSDLTPERIDNEQALKLIRSCKAASVIRLHSGDWQLKLKTGAVVLVPRPNPSALKAATTKAMGRGCETAIGTE